jgi:SAM-dependent methyltransferase
MNMQLKNMKGMKYPDEYMIKFFFKEGLCHTSGNVLEFGCGNGNNLMLFYQYGWNVTGIDINDESLANANYNFSLIASDNKYSFIKNDISQGISNNIKGHFDAILFPGVLNYISRLSTEVALTEVRKMIKNDVNVFLRMRGVKDYRYGRGKRVEHNGFILNIRETGEYGNLNVFYYEYELVDMLRKRLGIDEKTMKVFSVEFLNIQQGIPIFNSDIVIWGKCSIPEKV